MLARSSSRKVQKPPGMLSHLGWLKNYSKNNLGSDFIAGLIVAVMLVPQAMAYAQLAGLPPVVGLYASTLPLIVYALFGSSRQLAVGPVAIVSLFTLSSISQFAAVGSSQFIAYAVTLALLVGLIQFMLGLFRVGFITNFLSHAVISGFTSAAALIIGLSQVKHLLGLKLERSHSVFESLMLIAQHLSETNLIALSIGALSIALLLGFKRVSKRFPTALLVIVLASAVVYFFGLEAQVSIVGEVPQGLASFSLPTMNFTVLQQLFPIALTISFIGFMESIAVAKSMAMREKYKLNANQELIALGLANITTAFFKGYPITGGFSRSAVNYQAGAKSPLASIITASIIMLTLLFFTPLFYYLPNAVLAAIVIVAVIGLIDIKEAIHLFKLKAVDGWTLLLTFIATLSFGIEQGILIGAGFSLLIFIRRSAYPHTAELGYVKELDVFRNVRRYPDAQTYPGVFITRVDASLYFANMNFLENKLNDAVAAKPDLHTILLDFSAVNDIDAVALDNLEQKMLELKEQGIAVHISGMKGPVRDLAIKAAWFSQFPNKLEHPSLKQALKELKEADVKFNSAQ